MHGGNSKGEHLHEGSNYPSPFTKILALGWNDGPTDGLLECHPDDRVFRFDLLEEVRCWGKEEEDLRVFTLGPLPPDSLRQLAEAYTCFSSPHWPLWSPVWKFPTAADREAMERLTDQVLSKAGPTEWLIASTDLLRTILAARRVSSSQIGRGLDWATLLGLDKEKTVTE
jgi:hypothetical protein